MSEKTAEEKAEEWATEYWRTMKGNLNEIDLLEAGYNQGRADALREVGEKAYEALWPRSCPCLLEVERICGMLKV